MASNGPFNLQRILNHDQSCSVHLLYQPKNKIVSNK